MRMLKPAPIVAAILGSGLFLPALSAAPALPSETACKARVNDTPARLLPCIQRHALWRHLRAFQEIADENPGRNGRGNRDTGTAGYRASVDYVARLMGNAGYRVTVQPYEWKRFSLLAASLFAGLSEPTAQGKDWFVARLSGNGSVEAAVQPLPGANEESASGCSKPAFAAFPRGRIALLRRGSCGLDSQVANAESAGAAAILIYNASAGLDGGGEKGRDDGRAFPAQLETAATVPVIGVTDYALGAALDARYRAGLHPRARVLVRAERRPDIDYNVIADSPYGDPKRTVVVDAHLDSIYGAGILDNASGSATILELALNLAHTPTRNRLRYIWFGGEEIGLLGSKFYTRHLDAKARREIVFDIDADVTATPNFDVLIADPAHAHNAKKFPRNVAPESEVGNRAFLRYFRSIGIAARKASFGNDGTDSNSFSLIGIPNTGILTQQNCCKHRWEVRLWGGYPGNYEGKVPGHNGGCVDWPRRWCDNLSNNDAFVLEFASRGVAAAGLTLANRTLEHRGL